MNCTLFEALVTMRGDCIMPARSAGQTVGWGDDARTFRGYDGGCFVCVVCDRFFFVSFSFSVSILLSDFCFRANSF